MGLWLGMRWRWYSRSRRLQRKKSKIRSTWENNEDSQSCTLMLLFCMGSSMRDTSARLKEWPSWGSITLLVGLDTVRELCAKNKMWCRWRSTRISKLQGQSYTVRGAKISIRLRRSFLILMERILAQLSRTLCWWYFLLYVRLIQIFRLSSNARNSCLRSSGSKSWRTVSQVSSSPSNNKNLKRIFP